MKVRSSRWVIVCLFIMVASIGILLLSGCGSSSTAEDEAAIRSVVSEQFDSVKSTTSDEWLADKPGLQSSLEKLGIDPGTFFDDTIGSMDYSIEDVSIDGDSATATVEVSCTDVSQAIEGLDTSIRAYLDGLSTNYISSDDTYRHVGAMITDALDGDTAPKTDRTLTVDLVRGDGGWELADSQGLSDEITTTLVGDLSK